MRFPADVFAGILALQPRVFLLSTDGDSFISWAELQPGKITMASAVTVNIGHAVNMSIVFLDQNGNPMLTAPAPDAVPAWANSTPATGTLVVAADGLSAVETALAAGSDVVTLSLAVGGTAFTATLPITVAAAAQVLTSIDISAAVA
jgi:hypothetical protein